MPFVALEFFEFWNKFAIEMFQKEDKIGSMVPQERPKSVQVDTPPPRFRKTGREKDALPDERAMQMVPKWQPKSESLA